MQYVGEGGSYVVETTYRPVGLGQGDFIIATRPSSRGFVWVLTAITLLLALLALIIFLLVRGGSVTTTTTQLLPNVVTTTQPIGGADINSCVIWGDPHIRGFDGERTDFLESGDFWLLKSAGVHMQGRFLPTPFTNGYAATHQVAIGGPGMQGARLEIGPMEHGQITCSGQVVLPEVDMNAQCGSAEVTYNERGAVVDEGFQQTVQEQGLPTRVVHIDVPIPSAAAGRRLQEVNFGLGGGGGGVQLAGGTGSGAAASPGQVAGGEAGVSQGAPAAGGAGVTSIAGGGGFASPLTATGAAASTLAASPLTATGAAATTGGQTSGQVVAQQTAASGQEAAGDTVSQVRRVVHLQVMRWTNHLNIRIDVPADLVLDGVCGNNNADKTDDGKQAIEARGAGRVTSQMIFHHRAAAGQPVTVTECEPTKRQQASLECSQKANALGVQGSGAGGNSFDFDSCVFDTCFGGKQYAAEDEAAFADSNAHQPTINM